MLSDCSECWESLCTCGHKYKFWTDKEIVEQIQMLNNLLTIRKLTKRNANGKQ